MMKKQKKSLTWIWFPVLFVLIAGYFLLPKEKSTEKETRIVISVTPVPTENPRPCPKIWGRGVKAKVISGFDEGLIVTLERESDIFLTSSLTIDPKTGKMKYEKPPTYWHAERNGESHLFNQKELELLP